MHVISLKNNCFALIAHAQQLLSEYLALEFVSFEFLERWAVYQLLAALQDGVQGFSEFLLHGRYYAVLEVLLSFYLFEEDT